MSGGGGEDDADRPHEPTERRLEQARERGDVPLSAETLAAAAAAGLLMALWAFGPGAIEKLGTAGMHLLSGAGGAAAGDAARGGATAMLLAVAPIFLAPVAAALAAALVQGPLVAATTRIAPQLSRLSPLAGLRNRFGIEGLSGFARSVVKLAAVMVALWYFAAGRIEELAASGSLPPRVAILLLVEAMLGFALVIVALQIVVAAADALLQRALHRRRNRMSHRDLREEIRQSEGDPYLRATRRQRAEAVASNRMMRDVPSADVVIVNPTHYAVALRWDRDRPGAPVCVAKGVDAVALRIIAAATDAGVPVRHDPPTARILHAALEIGAEVAPTHYRAVAAAIRFADAVRRRAQVAR